MQLDAGVGETAVFFTPPTTLEIGLVAIEFEGFSIHPLQAITVATRLPDS
jgi:hypothetical protein